MATGTFIILILILGMLMAAGIFLVSRGSKQLSQSRRSFLRARRDDEGGRAIFFGLQIVVQVFGSDDLRAHLERLIQAEDETDTAAEKRRFVKSVASLLTENQYAWEYGFWEYLDEPESAIGTFNQWRNEIEASMATEAVELGTEVDRLSRFSDQKEFVIVTLLMLIDNRDEPVIDDVGDYDFRPTCAQLAAPFRAKVNSLQKSEYWSVATFGELLEQVRALDPRVIERDAIYIYPGSAQDGLSSLDLLGDSGWKYLIEHSFRLQ
jgi:Protein of unknown function (DUF1517)